MNMTNFIAIVRRSSDSSRVSTADEKLLLSSYNKILEAYSDKLFSHFRFSQGFIAPAAITATVERDATTPFMLTISAIAPAYFDTGYVAYLISGTYKSRILKHDAAAGKLYMQNQVPSSFTSAPATIYASAIDTSAVTVCFMIGSTVQTSGKIVGVYHAGPDEKTPYRQCREVELSDTPSAFSEWMWHNPLIRFKYPVTAATAIFVKGYRHPDIIDLTKTYTLADITVDFPDQYHYILATEVAAGHLRNIGDPEGAAFLESEIKEYKDAMNNAQIGILGDAYAERRRTGLFVRA